MTLYLPDHRQTPAVEVAPVQQRPAPVWPRGLVAAAVAAVTTTLMAVIAKAAGVDFGSSLGDVPISAFPMLTIYCSLIGIIIAEVTIRVAKLPRSTFQITAIVLTGLSLIPDVLPLFEFDLAFVGVLCLTHVVAAAIVVPMIALRMEERRGLGLPAPAHRR
ncbi:DUF6069 family protein [Nocardioides albus]|uniref:Peptidoglycan/LPS O-acetylase OafA/YrhL n=1 Tax=Nocardioides albus TaxID=1841 RepID=A0A7W5A7R9_9ACTN|nr:DUF6069 family protein [Nocardioides albus]MBB3091176.1 peptidoglycan/LPS O-acetylase OafA/YrhL [Nocardioides albus]GGU33811.1 hypothetical protein GCM10007979_36070 [Nocardioides albus]